MKFNVIDPEHHGVLRQAIDTYGRDAQIIKAIEELSELIKALCKGDIYEIIDEAADVAVMLQQILMVKGIEYEVESRIGYKIWRLQDRMDYRRYGGHIKSQDLCERCKINTKCMGTKDCLHRECGAFDNRIGCTCVEIEDGTPCTYFEEDDEEA